MSKFLRKPKDTLDLTTEGRFHRFGLTENPFPSEPVVNKESEDKRINGDIYEYDIRTKEYHHFIKSFIMPPQSDPNHIRLGYIIDTSYIGRGNGKTAFLVNLQNDINNNFCLDLSDGLNKCFAIYVTPEPGGRTKTFSRFVDSLFISLLRSRIIATSLIILRLEAISALQPSNPILTNEDEAEIFAQLGDLSWYNNNNINLRDVNELIRQKDVISDMGSDFPLFRHSLHFHPKLVSQDDFEFHYSSILKRPEDRLVFVFSHLVKLFKAAGFNGSYVLVDDFERIPDFQSARQRKDFALELRSTLFDGSYLNARIGFYNVVLVLHAGVQRLISDSWAQSGLENRAPISPQTQSSHIIPFGKLNKDHAILLLKKYLKEYRIEDATAADELAPFTVGAVELIGQYSEYNAAKILKTAYDLLENALNTPGVVSIDERFVTSNRGGGELSLDDDSSIDQTEATDLIKKAQSKD